MPQNLKRIDGVEVFSVGTWNGDKYTEADLDEMVRAFKETNATFRPPLKLGHSNDQTLLQQDGLPAAGWIGNLYRMGKKLCADFIDLPEKIYDLLAAGAYKKVSAEIYWDAKVGDSKYRRLLSAIALLGADRPAVSNLNDIFQMYEENIGELKHYDLKSNRFILSPDVNPLDQSIPQGDKDMPEKTEKEIRLEAELEAEKAKLHTLSTNLEKVQKDTEAKDKELESLRSEKTAAETKALETEKKLFDAQVDRDLTEMQGEKLLSKAMRPYVKALLSEDKKEYSFDGKDKEAKKNFSKAGLLKEILKLHAAACSVNFTESSEDNQVEGERLDDKVLDEKIKQYAKEHDISYGDAYKVVMKEVAA